MENKDFFRAKRYDPKDSDVTNEIFSDDLLALLKDESFKEAVKKSYGLDRNYKIEIEKIGSVYSIIQHYSSRFDLIRLEAPENGVSTELKTDEKTGKHAFFFSINGGNENGIIYDSVEAEAIYDSIDLFYKDKSLTQYVKSMDKKSNKRRLLNDLNESWARYYKENEKDSKIKLFRILNYNDQYYLKSINSPAYKEYGIAESFVMAMLELYKFKLENPQTEFFISSVFLSESKLDLIVSQKKSLKIEGLGFLRSSISIRNEDQGNTSLGVYSTIEFYPESGKEGKIYLYPNKDGGEIKNNVRVSHVVGSEKFFETFSNVSRLFNMAEEMKSDFKFFAGSKSYDELRAKIEHKINSNNSPFKDVRELKDLFSRLKTGHIDNLETLLRICAKSDLIEMDYDLKFKLRYLISNVLIYNKDNY